MSDAEVINARVEGTRLGFEDHGIPTYYIQLHHERGHQSYGGYGLFGNFTHRAIFDLLKVLKLRNWEDLPGTYVRIKFTKIKIQGIGHVIEDRWFDLKEIALEEEQEK
jgi:hypothetical protein